MTFSDSANTALTQTTDRTLLDKLLANKEVYRIRQLMRKSPLTRGDLLELIYLIAGTEAKLVNFDDWDRYVVLKYYVWVREYMRLVERTFDFAEWIDKKNILLSAKSERLYSHTRKNMEHDIKYLVDVYLNIIRTSLSVKGAGFFEPMKQKAEIVYPYGTPAQSFQNPENKKFLWGK